MSNWLDSYQGENNSENEIILLLKQLKNNIPTEEKTIDELIKSLENESIDEEILLEIRDRLRRIISKEEHNLIRKKDFISKTIRSISEYKNKNFNNNSEEFYDFEDCFFDNYDFQKGNNFYYLRFPSLHVKADGDIKTELMLDRYIKDFIKSGLSNYQLHKENYEQFSEFTLIIIHHLLEENAIKIDTDNIEIKKPIDAINKVLIKNDTANYSDIFQIVELDDKEYTEMYVIKGHSLSRSVLSLLEGVK